MKSNVGEEGGPHRVESGVCPQKGQQGGCPTPRVSAGWGDARVCLAGPGSRREGEGVDDEDMGMRGMSPTRREGSDALPGVQGDALARSREDPTKEEVMVAGEDGCSSSRHRDRGDAARAVSTGIAGERVGVADKRGKGATT